MKNYYSDTEVFNAGKDSFNVAFGLHSLTGESIVDESIGRFDAHSYEEGWDKDGNLYAKFHNHSFHRCSREELGLEGDNS